MLQRARDAVRRAIRGRQWGGCYPVVLPHVGLREKDQGFTQGFGVQEDIRWLGLCDGTRALDEVTRTSGVRREQVIGCHDQGMLVMWPTRLTNGEPRMYTRGFEVDTIIVSPHPDDAALSVGGQLLSGRLGSVLVLDLFSQVAWWRLGKGTVPLERKGGMSPFSVRRAEERLMARMAGVGLMMLDLPEALLRRDGMEGVFSGRDERDEEVVGAVEQAAIDLAGAHPKARWMLPLGVGGHVDHVIARDAALAGLARSAGFSPYERPEGRTTNISFYEDLPYAAKQRWGSGELGSGEANDAFPTPLLPHFPTFPHLSPLLVDIGSWLRWKLELCRVYWSQFTWPQIRQLGDYARRIGDGHAAERLWMTC